MSCIFRKSSFEIKCSFVIIVQILVNWQKKIKDVVITKKKLIVWIKEFKKITGRKCKKYKKNESEREKSQGDY